jgi:tetratricopeptide (TPR) repeat protein
MSLQQPTQRQRFCLRWVGLSFFWLTSIGWAQTPVPSAPTKPTSAEPVVAAVPAAPSAESGSQLVRKAESVIQQTGSPVQAMALYQTAAQAFHRTGEVEPEALAWHRIAQLAVKAGYPQQAKAAADKARTLLHVRTLPTRPTAGLARAQAARAYLTLGRIHIESGEVREAIAAYRTGLDAALAAQLPRESAAGYVALGRIAAEGDDVEVAIRMTGTSLDFWRAAKDFNGEAMALNNLARFYERKGDLPLAAQLDEQAIQVTRFSRNYRGEGDSLNEALRVHLLLGNHDAAAQVCEQLISLSRLRGEKKKESEQTITLAVIEAQRNHLPSAYQLLLRAFIVGADNNKELAAQIKEFTRKLEAAPKPVPAQREQLLNEAEFEAKRGDYAAAYQLLLRALVMNEGKSDVLNAALNARIRTLAKQIEAQQKKPKTTRP